ncbi:urea carboxylase [Aurantivibrio plasticivorans]
MFSKVLIVNRGAIAVRIIRTLRKLGIDSVAVYAEADIDSLHVTQADEAYCLGSGAATDTYLNQDKVLQIAKETGAQAIHPGYGFLSENPTFVERCNAAGVIFIGPTAEQMNVFGLKHSARALAQENQVPLLPGSNLLTDLDEAITSAASIGYPVMLKSTAGGGGIGMQICQSEAELCKAFDSVKRLSANNFSNDGVFVEKYIERARHIEVQAFGDGQGRVVTLGERDCSAQRRHQKVIEECPAPNLTDDVRRELATASRRLLEAVDYRNAGTVEFIFDQATQAFYFLEVNTRLQVEHGVTEEVFGVDLVEWMLRLASNNLPDLQQERDRLTPKGWSIQTRIYAENPAKNFQPSAGLLGSVSFPTIDETIDGRHPLRIDHWVEPGVEVSPFFDPMLAKVIVWSDTRDAAIAKLQGALRGTTIQGVETNSGYVSDVLCTDVFKRGEIFTRFLNDFAYLPSTIDVLAPGTMTTIQDYPGRTGYWDVGVPPSGPFDSLAFQLGNNLLGNDGNCAGLEITLTGPKLQFNHATSFILTGAVMDATLNQEAVEFYRVYHTTPGDVLDVGRVKEDGARAYLLVAGGVEGNDYLGSQSTFSLGQFGGFSGRALRTGDVLHVSPVSNAPSDNYLTVDKQPTVSDNWQVRVLYGPHGAPDFFTPNDIDSLFSSEWEVHYNSSRTGVRLVGPKPEWARETGGEAGMHPSNIHDNAYAVGTVDFTGDMPVILGPDGPSLGGFVCPVTVIAADLWKLGQLKAGAKIKFVPVTQQQAKEIEVAQQQYIQAATGDSQLPLSHNAIPVDFNDWRSLSPIVDQIDGDHVETPVVYRQAGDKYLLVEYGPLVLDISLRFRAHALMLSLQEQNISGVLELTPGIRSLQIHYDNHCLPLDKLLSLLKNAEQKLQSLNDLKVPSRIVRLPLSWDDEACRQAIEKYMQSVRKDAPWCPSNIEFIRRINGLSSIGDVKNIVFSASYVVMGLGDVYLGAPVATPLDPRHRLVTTKYNPARTWTAENSVGIGGSYLCVYGMEGPGGYQFVGRTLQMWNRYRKTHEFTKPWLLRFFDQIQFYEVTADELTQIRSDFPRGQYPIDIVETEFSLNDYETFLSDNQKSIELFTEHREQAFAEELQRWVDSGQINFSSIQESEPASDTIELPENSQFVDSSVAGSIWQWRVEEGEKVSEGDVVCVLESMKMEIELYAPDCGVVKKILRQQGQAVQAGQAVMILENT